MSKIKEDIYTEFPKRTRRGVTQLIISRQETLKHLKRIADKFDSCQAKREKVGGFINVANMVGSIMFYTPMSLMGDGIKLASSIAGVTHRKMHSNKENEIWDDLKYLIERDNEAVEEITKITKRLKENRIKNYTATKNIIKGVMRSLIYEFEGDPYLGKQHEKVFYTIVLWL